MQHRVAQRGGEMAFGKQQGRRPGDAEPLCVLVVSFLINLRSGEPGRARQIAPSDSTCCYQPRLSYQHAAELKDSGRVCVCGPRARLSSRVPLIAGRWGGGCVVGWISCTLSSMLPDTRRPRRSPGRPGRGT